MITRSIRCSFAWPLELLHPSCDAQNMFWHMRGTADQAQMNVVRGWREASRTPRTCNSLIPTDRTPVHSIYSESCCSLRRMRRAAEGQQVSSFAPNPRVDFTSLSVPMITHLCVMIPPPKKRVLPIQKDARRLTRPQAQSDTPASRPREH